MSPDREWVCRLKEEIIQDIQADIAGYLRHVGRNMETLCTWPFAPNKEAFRLMLANLGQLYGHVG